MILDSIRSRISLLLTYEYNLVNNFAEFGIILSQYDALIIRSIECIMLNGCGMPPNYIEAGYLNAWRQLILIIPLNIISSQTKFEVLKLILRSLFQTDLTKWHRLFGNSKIEDWVLDDHVNQLHQILLCSSGLNRIGLEAVLNCLGKFALAECKPWDLILSDQSMDGNKSSHCFTFYEPKLECQMIQYLMKLIFGVS